MVGNIGKVFLIFMIAGTQHIQGICRMISDIDLTKNFPYWEANIVLKGLFNIEWIFIKDIPIKYF